MAKIQEASFVVNISKLVKTQNASGDFINSETQQAILDILEATIAEVIGDNGLVVEAFHASDEDISE